MSSDGQLKVCVECRAEVPSSAETCPECGYPFGDIQTVRCSNCNNIVVADVNSCPVCGQLVEPLITAAPAAAYQHEQRPVLSSLDSQPQVEITPSSAGGSLDATSYAELVVRLETIKQAIQELAHAMQANNKINDDIARVVIESNNALQQGIQANQVQNQNALQQSVDLIKVVYESLGGSAGSTTNLTQVASELKIGLVELASQQTTSANMVISAINDAAAKAADNPGRLPRSIKWLDYMFIAIIMVVIFTVVNMMVVAYMVRLMLMD